MVLNEAPGVRVGMLIRRAPHDGFEPLANPAITTRFWYTKRTHDSRRGALVGMGDVRRRRAVSVLEVEPYLRIRFHAETDDADHPTTGGVPLYSVPG
jgi:uncharacterized protein YndB with AHSA1/START domain